MRTTVVDYGRGALRPTTCASGTAAAEAPVEFDEPAEEVVRRQKAGRSEKPRRQPRYHVILWDDNHHTYAYVVLMMLEIFGYQPEKGYQIAKEVDTRGRAIVITTTKEHAELKRDQIHAYGKDALIDGCKGSMWATIEAAE
jgi:ATP-dependent Clp protease adaptor protein ClpS